jgi:hypothetical protein
MLASTLGITKERKVERNKLRSISIERKSVSNRENSEIGTLSNLTLSRIRSDKKGRPFWEEESGCFRFGVTRQCLVVKWSVCAGLVMLFKVAMH